jgi:hypothetical protein
MRLLFTVALFGLVAVGQVHAQSPASQSVPGAEVPHVVAPSNQEKQWQPTARQRELALRAALAYLAAKDARRFADAYAMFTVAQKAVVPFGRWEADMQAIYGQAGDALGRTLKQVTWYKNPVNAPPGVYAAVDFSSQFSELSLHCGFVAMQEQMDGSFSVAREEENAISKREMARLAPDALQRIRAQYRC